MPEKLAELQELWLTEARKYNVLPLDDRLIERFNSDLAGRPVLVTGQSQMLYGGMGRLTEASVLNIKNKSHAVTAEVEVPESGAEGVIIAQGGAFAGWSLYTLNGNVRYCYNLLGLRRFTIEGDRPIPAGTHQVRMEFSYDGGGLAKGGTVRALRRRDQGWAGAGRGDHPAGLLGRRDRRHRPGHRLTRQRRLPRRQQHFHRPSQLGADRSRRGRRGRRPPHHTGGTAQGRDGASVADNPNPVCHRCARPGRRLSRAAASRRRMHRSRLPTIVNAAMGSSSRPPPRPSSDRYQ